MIDINRTKLLTNWASFFNGMNATVTMYEQRPGSPTKEVVPSSKVNVKTEMVVLQAQKADDNQHAIHIIFNEEDTNDFIGDIFVTDTTKINYDVQYGFVTIMTSFENGSIKVNAKLSKISA